MALRKSILSCILFVIAHIGLFAQNTTIHVRVLDGRTGRNLAGMRLAFVDYHSDPDKRKHDDLNGRLPVKSSLNGDSYTVSADIHGVLVFDGLGDRTGFWTPCTRQKFVNSQTQTYGEEHLYPVSTILTTGLVSKNSCSKKTAVSEAGELILFVRPTTWWERFISGMRE
jgi:hypothetical protein